MVCNVLGKHNERNRNIRNRNRCYVLTVDFAYSLCRLKECEIGHGNNAHIFKYFKVYYLECLIICSNAYNRKDCRGCIARKYAYNERNKLYHFLAVNRADCYNQKGYKSAKQANKRVGS